MSSESIGENPSVVLRSNWLTVNGATLRADALKNSRSERLTVSAEELQSVLLLGRRAIVQGIEEFYSRHQPYASTRPSIWTVHLGTTAQTDGRNSKVFTERGYANGGVNTSIDEIQPRFHGHWNAIKEAGFLPEVRRTSGTEDGGSWLLLRKPSLNEVLHHWFGYPEEALNEVIATVVDEDKGVERRNLRIYRMLGERIVDKMPDRARSRMQIGQILSMAAIKSALGDKTGYEDEVDDAFTYADNDFQIDPSTIRAMENSTFELDHSNDK